METSTNLKRRRDSGEGAAKKCALNDLRQAPTHRHKAATSSNPTSTSTTILHPNLTALTTCPASWHPLTSTRTVLFKKKKKRRPYQFPLPRSQSADKSQPLNLTRTSSLLSLIPSDFSTHELFPATQKEKHDPSARKKPSGQEGETFTIKQIQQAEACAQ